MDIGRMSTIINQVNTQSQVGIAVLKIGMESAENMAINQIEQIDSVKGIGENIDRRV